MYVNIVVLVAVFGLVFLAGDVVLLHEVQAVQFLDGEEVHQVLRYGRWYIVELFFAFED